MVTGTDTVSMIIREAKNISFYNSSPPPQHSKVSSKRIWSTGTGIEDEIITGTFAQALGLFREWLTRRPNLLRSSVASMLENNCQLIN